MTQLNWHLPLIVMKNDNGNNNTNEISWIFMIIFGLKQILRIHKQRNAFFFPPFALYLFACRICKQEISRE